MIQIVTGKLGAGKTLYTVGGLLYKSLTQGKTVCTNIQVNWDQLKEYALKDTRLVLEDDQLIQLDPGKNRNWHQEIPFGIPGHPVEVFLDEIHLFFNARDWQKTGEENKTLLSFLTQSRKAAVNVTFIAQEITTVEKQFRVLAEWELFVQSSDHIKFGPLGHSPIKFFQVLQRDPVQGTVQKRLVHRYDPNQFKLYSSFSFLDEEMNELFQNALKVQPKKLQKIPYRTIIFRFYILPIIKLPIRLFNLIRKLFS